MTRTNYLGGVWCLRAFLPGSSPSLPIAVHINSIVLWGFVPFGVAFIFSGVVRATGAVWPPLLAMIISLWVVRVPLAALLEPHMGADAIWISFPIARFISMISHTARRPRPVAVGDRDLRAVDLLETHHVAAHRFRTLFVA